MWQHVAPVHREEGVQHRPGAQRLAQTHAVCKDAAATRVLRQPAVLLSRSRRARAGMQLFATATFPCRRGRGQPVCQLTLTSTFHMKRSPLHWCSFSTSAIRLQTCTSKRGRRGAALITMHMHGPSAGLQQWHWRARPERPACGCLLCAGLPHPATIIKQPRRPPWHASTAGAPLITSYPLTMGLWASS